jgi:hypothetical protein
MPHLTRRLSKHCCGLTAVGVSLVLSATVSGVAATPAMADQAAGGWCSDPSLTQPFLAWGDQNYYTLVRGQGSSGFRGFGWRLAGGASAVATRLSDGSTGGVLDLPSGSTAVSPAVCVNSTFPDARMLVNDVTGDEGVEVYVSYRDTGAWGSDWSQPVDIGGVNGGQSGWALSDPVDLPAPGDTDWQLARFTFVAGGTSSEFQIYDFYLDPYGRG